MVIKFEITKSLSLKILALSKSLKVEKTSFIISSDLYFIFFVSGKLDFEKIYFEKIFSSPCLQVSTYNYGEAYYEISWPLLSFCDSVWCGFNNSILAYQNPSTWLCLPNR